VQERHYLLAGGNITRLDRLEVVAQPRYRPHGGGCLRDPSRRNPGAVGHAGQED
jgi:hypothetical protein